MKGCMLLIMEVWTLMRMRMMIIISKAYLIHPIKMRTMMMTMRMITFVTATAVAIPMELNNQMMMKTSNLLEFNLKSKTVLMTRMLMN